MTQETGKYQVCKDIEGNYHTWLPHARPKEWLKIDVLTVQEMPVDHFLMALKWTQDQANRILTHYL